ncbi:MAG: Maf family protein [Acidobacteriia bacterium]|nr:Maf family protein [Terriglobia bacterium]
MRLILASASPRRAELLRAAGYTFETIVTDVDEQLRPGETPVEYVRRLAAEKSAAALEVVARPFQGRERGAESPALRDVIILGADTTVVVDGDVLGKPQDDEEAAAMLRRLSGRAHEVLTGISLRDSASEVGKVETTSVSFRALSDGDVAWYVSSGEGRDKAGGYAIQGLASRFVSVIRGSYSNVVGLPMEALAELLPEVRR